MKYDIIKTDDYLLVVDEREIKEGEYTYYPPPVGNGGIGKAIITQQGWNKKIIAHLPLNDSPILEGVDLLPLIQDQDDIWKHGLEDELKKLPYTKHLDDGQYNDGQLAGFEWGAGWGYNQAKEKYKYTEEDIRKAFLKGVSITGEGYNAEYAQGNDPDIECVFGEEADKFIQSLSQPKMPIGFERELVNIMGKGEPITERNSQGHIQWVGKYIYL